MAKGSKKMPVAMGKGKMTMAKFEGSKADDRMDKKKGFKEGSKKDNAADRAAVNRINAGKMPGFKKGGKC